MSKRTSIWEIGPYHFLYDSIIDAFANTAKYKSLRVYIGNPTDTGLDVVSVSSTSGEMFSVELLTEPISDYAVKTGHLDTIREVRISDGVYYADAKCESLRVVEGSRIAFTLTLTPNFKVGVV
jgi:hypothetical protein